MFFLLESISKKKDEKVEKREEGSGFFKGAT